MRIQPRDHVAFLCLTVFAVCGSMPLVLVLIRHGVLTPYGAVALVGIVAPSVYGLMCYFWEEG